MKQKWLLTGTALLLAAALAGCGNTPAADQAAKEVAQYSYILEKIGILDSLDGLNSRSEDFEKNIKSI